MPKIVKKSDQSKDEAKPTSKVVKTAKEQKTATEQVPEDQQTLKAEPTKLENKNKDPSDPSNIVKELLEKYFKIENHEKDESIEETYNLYKKKFGVLCEIETSIAECRSDYIQVMQDLHVKFKRVDAAEGAIEDVNNDADVDPVLEKESKGGLKKDKKTTVTKTVKKRDENDLGNRENDDENDDLGNQQDEADADADDDADSGSANRQDEVDDDEDEDEDEDEEEVVIKTKSSKKKESENDPSDVEEVDVKKGKTKNAKVTDDSKKKPVEKKKEDTVKVEKQAEKKPAAKKPVTKADPKVESKADVKETKTVKKPPTGAKGKK